ncbi:MAG: ribonuclease T [Succinivibrionaceae bacterium]
MSITTKDNLEDTNINTQQNTFSDRFRGFYPVIIDVETAGFNPKTDALLEVAAVTLKFDENGCLIQDEVFHANITPFPGAVLNESNLKFLGYKEGESLPKGEDEKIALTRIFKAISKKAKECNCKRSILVGHNAFFDHSFITAAIERIKYKRSPFHPFSVIDTASLSMIFFGQSVLRVACIAAGIDFDETKAHGAIYDTEKEAELFCYLVNKYKELGGWPLPDNIKDRATQAALNKEVYNKE